MRGIDGFNDRIFRIKTGSKRKTRQSQSTDQHHHTCERDAFEQATHPADILFVMHGMNDRTRT